MLPIVSTLFLNHSFAAARNSKPILEAPSQGKQTTLQLTRT